MQTQIYTRGIKELQRELRRADKRLPRRLRAAFATAAEIFAEDARRRANALGGVAAKVAPSIRAAGEQRRAKIRFGGARYPMAGGAEFGAIQNIPRRTARGTVRGWNQFQPWRGNSTDAGYFLFPSIRDDQNRERFLDELDDALDDVLSEPFPD